MKTTVRFGTDGIRGKAGVYPFTPDALRKIGHAIAQWSTEKYKATGRAPSVLLGHDTRESCDEIKKSLSEGLCSLPLTVTDAGVLPTPAILALIQEPDFHDRQFDFGIVISASHNPYTDNGIKLFDAKTGKLTPDDEKSITAYFAKQLSPISASESINRPRSGLSSKEHRPLRAPRKEIDGTEIYKKIVVSHFPDNLLAGKKIVLDCANGATYHVAPDIFAHLGATVIAHNTEPDGKNINQQCGALHPEVVQKLVIASQADIGFAFDGDGDRVITVGSGGKICDGDDILALLLQHPDFKQEPAVVGTIMTNHGLDLHLQGMDKKLLRTPVGDKHVAARLQKEDLLLGGETSGHIIMKNYLNTGDGIVVALKVVEAIMGTGNWGMETFTKTPQVLINVPIEQKKDLTKQPCAEIIADHETMLQDGRTVVRYSGTENLLRVMVEDQTEESAQSIAFGLSQGLKKALQNN